MTSPHDSWQQGGQVPNPAAALPPKVPAGRSAPRVVPRTRPVSVRIAVWLAVVTPVIATSLNAATAYVARNAPRDFAGGTLPTGSELSQLMSSPRSILACSVLAGLWILFAVLMRGGRNWARIVLAVAAGVWLLLALLGLAVSTIGLIVIDGPTTVVLGFAAGTYAFGFLGMIAFAMFAFRRSSNRFFRSGVEQ